MPPRPSRAPVAREREGAAIGPPSSASPSAIKVSCSALVERHRVFAMPFGDLVDQAMDRLEDRVQCVLVSVEDHPARQGAGAFLAECVEGQVDDLARIMVAGHARAAPRAPISGSDGFGDVGGERLLQPGGRTEMVEEIGVGPADPRRNRLQRDRLRPASSSSVRAASSAASRILREADACGHRMTSTEINSCSRGTRLGREGWGESGEWDCVSAIGTIQPDDRCGERKRSPI